MTWVPLEPDVFLSSGGATLTRQDDGTIFAKRYGARSRTLHGHLTGGLETRDGHSSGCGLRTNDYPRMDQAAPANGNLHLAEIDVQWFPEGTDSPTNLKVARASADFDQDGWTSAHAIDGDNKSWMGNLPPESTNHTTSSLSWLNRSMQTSGGKLAVTLKQLYPPKHLIGRFSIVYHRRR